MNRTLRVLIALALGLPILPTGSVDAGAYAAANAIIRYDVDSATGTSCVTVGANGSPWSQAAAGAQRIKTDGSNTTVTSETASTSAFALSVARDTIIVDRGPSGVASANDAFSAGNATTVITVSDADTVVVDPAVNWAGFSYRYLRPVCGTTSADGWIDVGGADRIVVTVQYEQGDLDALLWNIECKQAGPAAIANIIYPNEGDTCGSAGTYSSGFCSFATAGATANLAVETSAPYGYCRVVFKYSSTDASDAGANLERVSASIAKVVY